MTANRELRVGDTNDVGSTRCIEIDLVGTGLTYNTADNLAVLPENNIIHVDKLAKFLGYPLDEPYVIEHCDGIPDAKDDFPCPFTARDVLTRFLDIEGIPRASILSQLVPYVTDRTQRVWLFNLCEKDNRIEFKKYMEQNGKTLYELLTNEINSCKIPLEDLMHIIPHMQARYYTISSSSSCFPTSVHITGTSRFFFLFL